MYYREDELAPSPQPSPCESTMATDAVETPPFFCQYYHQRRCSDSSLPDECFPDEQNIPTCTVTVTSLVTENAIPVMSFSDSVNSLSALAYESEEDSRCVACYLLLCIDRFDNG